MSNNQNQNRLTRAIDWEDARAVLDVCDTVQGSVATVAGAGDIALSLLTKSFSSLTVIAANEPERMLFELKLKSIQSLHPDNVYNLLGIHPGGRRVFVYHQLREVLSAEAQVWWDTFEDSIRQGVIESGEQEQRHQRLKTWMKRLRLGVGSTSIQSLQSHKRWVLMEPIFHHSVGGRPMDFFWTDDNPYAHMLFHQQWSVECLQSGVLSLSYDGMKSIQRSTMELLMMTGSFRGWMDTESSETFAVVYLGSLSELSRTQTIDRDFWRQLSSLLTEEGMVLCWSLNQPTSSTLQWQSYVGSIRSVHSGMLWIGRQL